MTSTKPSKPPNDDVRTLQGDELDAVNGGFGMLQSTANDVVKSIGDGLKSMAQKG